MVMVALMTNCTMVPSVVTLLWEVGTVGRSSLSSAPGTPMPFGRRSLSAESVLWSFRLWLTAIGALGFIHHHRRCHGRPVPSSGAGPLVSWALQAGTKERIGMSRFPEPTRQCESLGFQNQMAYVP